MISIVVLGRSLTKALNVLPMQVVSFLERNRFSELIPGFGLDSDTEIYSTNSRHILANMNQMLPENQYASFSENSDVAKMENNDGNCYLPYGKLSITPEKP
jgi:hypothetical protein